MKKWFVDHAPSRETLLKNKWLAPLSAYLSPAVIWHFNRKTIARGIALGLFAGFLLPVGQVILAVLFAATVRANVLIASAATLVTNPLTFPPIYYAAYRTGSFVLSLVDQTEADIAEDHEAVTSILASISATSMATFIGLLIFAVFSSLAALLIVNTVWRAWLVRKWRNRHL